MDNLICLVVGMLLMYLILQKPLQITIHHKNENIINTIPESEMPEMKDVMKKGDTEEDKAYEEMGTIISNVNDIFGGSDRE